MYEPRPHIKKFRDGRCIWRGSCYPRVANGLGRFREEYVEKAGGY